MYFLVIIIIITILCY